MSLTNPASSFTLCPMNQRRNVTRIRLRPAEPLDVQCQWIQAGWERVDGSEGAALVGLRKSGDSWHVSRVFTEVAYLRDVPVARIEAAANADASVVAWLETKTKARRASTRTKLERPLRGGLNDAFYRRVAYAYRGAAASGLPPAKTLADDSGAPQSTVNRWIAESRRRGFLAAGEPGRVTV